MKIGLARSMAISLELLASIASISLMLAGCARTSMNGVLNHEEFRGPYGIYFISVATNDLQKRILTESIIKAEFETIGVKCICYNEVIYPGQSWPDSVIVQKMLHTGADAALVITLEDEGDVSVYIGGGSETNFSATSSGDQITGTAHTSTSPPTELKKHWMRLSTNLFDLATLHSVWYSGARTGGNAFAKNKTLWHSFAKELGQALIQDGLINPVSVNEAR